MTCAFQVHFEKLASLKLAIVQVNSILPRSFHLLIATHKQKINVRVSLSPNGLTFHSFHHLVLFSIIQYGQNGKRENI